MSAHHLAGKEKTANHRAKISATMTSRFAGAEGKEERARIRAVKLLCPDPSLPLEQLSLDEWKGYTHSLNLAVDEVMRA